MIHKLRPFYMDIVSTGDDMVIYCKTTKIILMNSKRRLFESFYFMFH